LTGSLEIFKSRKRKLGSVVEGGEDEKDGEDWENAAEMAIKPMHGNDRCERNEEPEAIYPRQARQETHPQSSGAATAAVTAQEKNTEEMRTHKTTVKIHQITNQK
jgi:hypothetical protein